MVSTVEPFQMLNRERIGLAGLSEKWFSRTKNVIFEFLIRVENCSRLHVSVECTVTMTEVSAKVQYRKSLDEELISDEVLDSRH